MRTNVIKKRDSIIIQYYVNKKQYRVYTGLIIIDSDWSKSKREVKGGGQSSKNANLLISKYQDVIQSYYLECLRLESPYDHEVLKARIAEIFMDSTPEENVGLLKLFQRFIETKRALYSEVTIRSYKNTLNHLRSYHRKGEIDINSLDKDWFDSFTSYLKSSLSHSPSTRGKQLKNLKAVLQYGFEMDLHSNLKFRYEKKEYESSLDIYLSEEEIVELYSVNGLKESERSLVDSFIFICLTGIRYSDFMRLTKENFRKEGKYWRIDYKQRKTKKLVSVPIIYHLAVQILEKYKFELRRYTNAYFNRELKRILNKENLFGDKIKVDKEQKVGVYLKRDLITIHCGRRSFATNQYLKNTPINLIMTATGHETEKAFRMYIKANSLEKAKGLKEYADY